ncbi:uncharacterized protein LOC111084111, partial [Limulus polyphemus]|uniref:Uncharacterized protein LOC111084111 n=1 Tax=Limulus polyphemus TaxID=6850 RepID=A0ABM1RZ01_LIMPO
MRTFPIKHAQIFSILARIITMFTSTVASAIEVTGLQSLECDFSQDTCSWEIRRGQWKRMEVSQVTDVPSPNGGSYVMAFIGDTNDQAILSSSYVTMDSEIKTLEMFLWLTVGVTFSVDLQTDKSRPVIFYKAVNNKWKTFQISLENIRKSEEFRINVKLLGIPQDQKYSFAIAYIKLISQTSTEIPQTSYISTEFRTVPTTITKPEENLSSTETTVLTLISAKST